ncbi:MAG: hypothetical protein AVDCRST_MAG23-930 [uncultured Sphingosinicella sp.]|uniref:Uncharacterized protein n=1 Tax=uncultured Sphingosinicella sp. TaxID=478748 RepID=A0A6J4TRU5_9SPHN|nr:MAG: hypothetical protein AVDCRST_MAG23-930 [uncultured Sphingosinicella sp.]
MTQNLSTIGPQPIEPALRATLEHLAPFTAGLAEPWWLFGSARRCFARC